MFEKMIKAVEEKEGAPVIGIIHYTETETHLYFDRNGKTYLYRKADGKLLVF